MFSSYYLLIEKQGKGSSKVSIFFKAKKNIIAVWPLVTSFYQKIV